MKYDISAFTDSHSMKPMEIGKNDQYELKSLQQNTILAVIVSRADRARFLPPHLFADPAWDMLLHLYSCHLSQISVSVSDLCVASNVPATTALRWIKALQDECLISRSGDPFDARRYFMALTEDGLRAMEGYFERQQAA